MIKRIIKVLHPVISMVRNYKRSKEQKKLKKLVVNTHHDVSQFDKNQVADMRKHGFSMSESALFDLKRNDYHDYISTWEAYQPRLANDTYKIISDDKYLFYQVFHKHINTPKVYAIIRNGSVISVDDNNISSQNIYDFSLKCGGIVIKETFGSDGFDVYVIHLKNGSLVYKSEIVDRNKLNSIVKKFKNGIVQEIFKQGSFENEIFPDAINTVRVISMKKHDSDEHEIIGALQRIGTAKSAPVDNFNQGGASALIDIETGEIGKLTSLFYLDDQGNHVFYERHPDTNSVICGKVIPNWNRLKTEIANTTKKLPFFKYIAWDIVVQDSGFAVIEINMKSSLNVFQIHRGLRNELLGKKYREAGYLENE